MTENAYQIQFQRNAADPVTDVLSKQLKIVLTQELVVLKDLSRLNKKRSGFSDFLLPSAFAVQGIAISALPTAGLAIAGLAVDGHSFGKGSRRSEYWRLTVQEEALRRERHRIQSALIAAERKARRSRGQELH